MRLITRRKFIKNSILTSSAIGLGVNHVYAVKKTKLVVCKNSNIETGVKKAMAALGGMKKFVKKGDKVVLKPNMSFANPSDWSTTTHPEVVATVAKLCLKAGAKRVYVVDHTLREASICIDKTGIGRACKEIKGVKIFTPTEEKFFKEVEIPQATELTKTKVIDLVLKADCLISIPTAKSHSATGVSFSMKGYMGLIWDRSAMHRDMDLNKAVAELATIIKPKLIIIDGYYALTTRGPGGPGEVTKPQTIIAGTDQVAVDSYSTGLAKWYNREVTGRKVKHILEAYNLGLGEIDVEKMDVVSV